MPVHLLDVNVLIAYAWAGHAHHSAARKWFAEHASEGWATCPITEAGFVRLSSNAKIIQPALTPAEALHTLTLMTRHPNHVFWPDSLPIADALRTITLTGHRQITDAYLAALAIHHGGKLATFDQAVKTLLADVDLIV